MKKLSAEELINCGISAYDNAQELIDEALILVGNFSYARSFVLSFTAFEELGKAYLLSLLGCKIQLDITKDKLEEDFNLARKILTDHIQKIQLGNLITIFSKNYENLTNQDELLNKTFDELELSDIPILLNKFNEINKPIIEMLQQTDEKDELQGKEVFISRNRSLYVDLVRKKNRIRITTPEDIYF